MIARSKRAPTVSLMALALTGVLLLPRLLTAGDTAGAVPARRDRCPVCGMFVARYPKWVARVVFRDGSQFFYDGAKDMFKHVFDIARYTPGRSANDVGQASVTDYYEVELIDAHAAFYVIGSDVLGPMGHELLPFRDEAAAREFARDHGGTAILRFLDVTPDVVQALDRRR